MRKWSMTAALVMTLSVAMANPIGDPPIGFFIALALLGALALEGLITFIEAIPYAVKLPLSFGRALGASAVANLASFAAGLLALPIYALLSRIAPNAFLQLVLAGLLSVGIAVLVETPVVLGMTRRYWQAEPTGALHAKIKRLAVVTNLWSCGALAAIFVVKYGI